MQKAYHTDPADLIAAIGPSICQDCYEVSEDVIEEFRQAYPETLHKKLFYRKPQRKVSAKPLGSLPSELPHQRPYVKKISSPPTSAPAATPIPLLPPRLPRQTRKPRSLPGTTIKKEPYTYKNTVYAQITIIIMVI